MPATALAPHQLRLTIPPDTLGFASTEALQGLPLPWIGQERAQVATIAWLAWQWPRSPLVALAAPRLLPRRAGPAAAGGQEDERALGRELVDRRHELVVAADVADFAADHEHRRRAFEIERRSAATGRDIFHRGAVSPQGRNWQGSGLLDATVTRA